MPVKVESPGGKATAYAAQIIAELACIENL
jgi:hypothetical protein